MKDNIFLILGATMLLNVNENKVFINNTYSKGIWLQVHIRLFIPMLELQIC